jgi:hypothetical protein
MSAISQLAPSAAHGRAVVVRASLGDAGWKARRKKAVPGSSVSVYSEMCPLASARAAYAQINIYKKMNK